MKNVITRAVGISPTVESDVNCIMDIYERYSYILLCSDGLTNHVSNEGIRDIVISADSRSLDQIKLSLTVRRLVDCANENGGSENITAVLVRI